VLARFGGLNLGEVKYSAYRTLLVAFRNQGTGQPQHCEKNKVELMVSLSFINEVFGIRFQTLAGLFTAT
jgi:hypothetical protein